MVHGKTAVTVCLALLMTVAQWAQGPVFTVTRSGDTGAGSGLEAAGEQMGGSGQDIEDLRALLIDLAAYHACNRLKGRILTLSSEGAGSPGSGAITGNIWVQSCETEQLDPLSLKFTISGQGWRWVSRQRERLGAEFEFDDYVKFNVGVSMVGTFDAAYDRRDHIATLWFLPTQPVDVDFRVLGDVDVDTGNLWSSIVGQGAEILGQSPEGRAREDIRSKGANRFQSRLDKGMTLVIDLCTGQRFTKLGSLPAGQIPSSASRSQDRPDLVENEAVLHRGGILFTGPYDTGKPLTAHLKIKEGGGVYARVVCTEEAKRIAEAYTDGGGMPDVEMLAQTRAFPGAPSTIRVPADIGCPVVLVMEPLNEQTYPIRYTFAVSHEGAKREPLVRCED